MRALPATLTPALSQRARVKGIDMPISQCLKGLNLNSAIRGVAVFLLLVLGTTTFGQTSSLVYEGANGKLAYGVYANQGETNVVNRLPDFAPAGYTPAATAFTQFDVKGGTMAVDDVAITLSQPLMKYMPTLILLQ
jgi:hypothetical protein